MPRQKLLFLKKSLTMRKIPVKNTSRRHRSHRNKCIKSAFLSSFEEDREAVSRSHDKMKEALCKMKVLTDYGMPEVGETRKDDETEIEKKTGNIQQHGARVKVLRNVAVQTDLNSACQSKCPHCQRSLPAALGSSKLQSDEKAATKSESWEYSVETQRENVENYDISNRSYPAKLSRPVLQQRRSCDQKEVRKKQRVEVQVLSDDLGLGSVEEKDFETARDRFKRQRNRARQNRKYNKLLSLCESRLGYDPVDLKDQEAAAESHLDGRKSHFGNALGGLNRQFKPPSKAGGQVSGLMKGSISDKVLAAATNQCKTDSVSEDVQEIQQDPRLKVIDPELIQRILNEVIQTKGAVTFDDIAGLNFAKQTIEEMIIWPLKNPQYYTGLRQIPKGLLLFGPPGTGKTLIGKAIAHSVAATFFSISASSLTSKWIGDGEKTVRALFAVAQVKQPSVVFIDEVDSLLGKRSDKENEASLRIKTEFLVRLEGVCDEPSRKDGEAQELILVIGATNRPDELDNAVRRRFVKRLYIPLPDGVSKRSLFVKLLQENENALEEADYDELVEATDGYSGADCANLAREASMGPLRDKLRGAARDSPDATLRAIEYRDFVCALRSIRASVSKHDLDRYETWNDTFGTVAYVQEKAS